MGVGFIAVGKANKARQGKPRARQGQRQDKRQGQGKTRQGKTGASGKGKARQGQAARARGETGASGEGKARQGQAGKARGKRPSAHSPDGVRTLNAGGRIGYSCRSHTQLIYYIVLYKPAGCRAGAQNEECT
jgi:hypothetical protein